MIFGAALVVFGARAMWQGVLHDPENGTFTGSQATAWSVFSMALGALLLAGAIFDIPGITKLFELFLT